MNKQNEYQYDVFISYSHADQEWVWNELWPRLEQVGIKVIIDCRDFEPGASLMREIERAVLTSRKTVLVLTPAYFDSAWTELENLLVQKLDPGARQRRLLPVLLQPCEIPLRIGALIYVDLCQPQLYDIQFQRLLDAIADDVPTHWSNDEPCCVRIPAGTFLMGSASDDSEAHGNEKPSGEHNIREYRIGRYPVTNAQYACFVRNTGYKVPEHWNERIYPAGLEDHPVVNVSHEDAEAYCYWLKQVTGEHYRVPTEEEWEKAARGALPEARRYPWGDKWEHGFCNTEEMGRNGTTSVHEFEHVNQSPFDVVDMAGNVWEWTASWYERYPGCIHQSLRYGRVYKVVRGGSWRNSRREARISCRGQYKPCERRPYLGFRIVLEAIGQGVGQT